MSIYYFSGKYWSNENPWDFRFADRVPVEVPSGGDKVAATKESLGCTHLGQNSGWTTDGSQYPGSQG